MRNIISTPFLHFNILLSLNFLISFLTFSIATDSITSIQSIRDGETILSSDESFKLGFFSPGNSKNRYLGIWYTKIPNVTVVWVANRNNPIADKSSVLKIGEQSNLVILNGAATVIWSSSSSSNKSNAGSPVIAQLLDSGNLVVREENYDDPEDFLWQSFDHPTDTLLPGMKLGWNLKTGMNRFLTSWKTSDDPSEGDYSFKIDLNGFPQAFITNRLKKLYRSGPWNGFQFSGVPEMKPNNIFDFSFTLNQEEIYYTFVLRNELVVSRLVMTQSGVIQRFTWQFNTSRTWNLYWYSPKDQCDSYMECGNYGICDMNDSPVCTCVRGYMPRFQQSWYLRDGSGGCVQKTKFECQKDDGFLKMKNMKVPDGTNGSFFDKNVNLSDCKEMCRKNCSCTAYSNSNILDGGGSGCLIWVNNLIDLRHYAEGGQDVYVRVAVSLLEHGGSGSPDDNSVSDSGSGKIHKTRHTLTIVATTIAVGILLLIGSAFYVLRRRMGRRKAKTSEINRQVFKTPGSPNKDTELFSFSLNSILTATDHFSIANKIGEGGFGSVFKGNMPDGEEIAIKRLSKMSGQGLEELMNELTLIAKLQHMNLVRLVGCCIEGEEKMLIYEYMPNKSLDKFLFDPTKQGNFNWNERYHIIEGVAQGLLYLHKYSRVKIIHRDLKASNILLDGAMNPKISDFGMARIFGGDQTEANTQRVVGTFGYMSPEYALNGLFSEKSDVFSFGVLLIEIVTGKKNSGFYTTEESLSLLGYTWQLWGEGRVAELVDASIRHSVISHDEVAKCIHIGLLCVQEDAVHRPTMSSVVSMLANETVTLPAPQAPTFFTRISNTTVGASSSINISSNCSINEVSITNVHAR